MHTVIDPGTRYRVCHAERRARGDKTDLEMFETKQSFLFPNIDFLAADDHHRSINCCRGKSAAVIYPLSYVGFSKSHAIGRNVHIGRVVCRSYGPF